MVASFVFLTPLGGLAALAALVPLAALALAERREHRGRAALGLPAPPARRRLPLVLAVALVPVLLGIAAMQPVLRTTTAVRVRTDAQAYYVIDTSRSMLASRSPRSESRIERARADAIRLRDELPEIPSGIATLTDRVLPDLLPNDDAAVFTSTMKDVVGVDEPPPATVNVIATSLNALRVLGTQSFYSPAAQKRVAFVFTDGESRTVDQQLVAKQLATGPRVHVIFIHVSSPDEAVYTDGKPESGYHEDPTSGQTLSQLAAAIGGRSFGEGDLAGAAAAAGRELGRGPTAIVGRSQRLVRLAPWIALLALVPLAVAVALTVVPGRLSARARKRSAARQRTVPSAARAG
jgi:hypothetical protein